MQHGGAWNVPCCELSRKETRTGRREEGRGGTALSRLQAAARHGLVRKLCGERKGRKLTLEGGISMAGWVTSCERTA
jgi:hypothetical protein